MTLTLELPPHIESDLAAKAAKRGVALPEYVLGVLESQVAPREAVLEEVPEEEPVHPLLQIADKIRASVPEEEWAKLPSDLSMNLDHYLYGHPKVKE